MRSTVACSLIEDDMTEFASIATDRNTTAILLVDHRPPVVPRSKRDDIDCDVGHLRLAPGDHVLHVEFQVAGWSMYVAEAYGVLEVPFESKAGRAYVMGCKKDSFSNQISCRIGDSVTDEWAGSAWMRGNDLDAYGDVLRAYAACGDEEAWVRLQQRPDHFGGDRQRLEKCDAFRDLR
jgi:hypothetical protein